ncbi:MAG TPA: hypothetical protein VH877_30470 [Polyangia bacterium]|nr:hypothetical protein [Polyangia bacterium]
MSKAMQRLHGTLTRIQERAHEELTNNAALSELVGHALLAQSGLPFTSHAERLSALLKACRRTRLGPTRNLLRQQLEPFLVGDLTDVGRTHQVGWEQYCGPSGELRQCRALMTSLVLKAPRPGGEKGVLYCSFESNWMRLVAYYDARAILDDYYLVGASSWSPTDFGCMAAFAGLSRDPIFLGVSNLADMEQIGIMRPVVEPLPILASDWAHPDHFSPKPQRERTIDILMIATWSKLKRHRLLFEALRDMPRHLRVVLVGRNAPGRTEKEVRAEAREMGVPQDLELHTNLEIWEVAALQCDAKISTIFTRREGSCVAVAESLMADTPVAMMEEAHIGSKSYINPQTGVLLGRQHLGMQLEQFLAEREQYTPRKWAIENISCMRTSARLNAALRDWALRTGRPWTEDIAPLCWRYVPAYVNPADEERLRPAVEQLLHRHGVEIKKFPGERASLAMKDTGASPRPAEASPESPPRPLSVAAL